MLSWLPTSFISQSRGGGQGAIGTSLRQKVQKNLESHTRVWLSTKDIPIWGDTRKLAPQFMGPFTILRVISPTAVGLRLPLTMRRLHPTFHVSRLKLVVSQALCSAPVPPPPSRIIDGGETFTVKWLMDCRRRGRGLQYLVNWEGYRAEERSWTPARFIIDKTLIRDYHKDQPIPPLKTPRGAS